MTDPEAKVVYVDEAELVLRMFTYLTYRDPDAIPTQKPARVTLAVIEGVIEAERDVEGQAALIIATDLTKMALAWIAAKTNEAHAGLMRKVSDGSETRQ